MKNYETVMGLEVHVELATESKLFCACSAKFGAEPNENVCPACAGMPGMPAVLNKRAVELGIAAGLLTNSEIANVMTFDKKNYFYPDLPTGYQITQLYSPICRNGSIKIPLCGGVARSDGVVSEKIITLKQIHIEEDAGKLVHDARTETTLVDFNRAGVPLIEIVSNPDFRTAEEVVAYLGKLRSLLSFAGISDCKMQEGSMRCDVNISVRRAAGANGAHGAQDEGEAPLGVRTEIKNMNSLKAIAAAIRYESQRHIDALETGCETLIQETRRWDDDKGETFSMRGKENLADYRYFPNPEIMPVCISQDWIEAVRNSMPKSSHEIYNLLTKEYNLPEYDGKIISNNKNLADIFEQTLKQYPSPREIAGWIIVELLSLQKEDNKEEISIDCGKFAKLIELVDNKTINRNVGKKLLVKVFEEGIDPVSYVEENKLGLVSDAGVIEDTVRAVLAENGKTVEEYKAGSQKVLGFLIGQAMRKLGGKADPAIVNSLMTKFLEE